MSPIARDLGPITLRDGTLRQVSSGDGDVPDITPRALDLNPPLGFPASSSDPDDAQVLGKRPLGGRTPHRAGGDLDAPSLQCPRSDSPMAQATGDEEFPARQQFPARGTPGFVLANDSYMQHAFLFPLSSSPLYQVVFPMGDLSRSVDHPLFAFDFEGLPHTKTFIRGGREGRAPVASQEVSAPMASPQDFRMVGADGKLALPLLSKNFKV